MHIRTRAFRTIAAVVALVLVLPLVGDPMTAHAAKSIKELEKSKKQVQGEITQLDNQLVDILSDINVLEANIAQNKADIQDAKDELKAAKKAEARQYRDMKGRMKYMYEHEQKSVFTMLIESGSIAEFLSRVEYARSVYEYDRMLLASYEATTEAIADLKNTLEETRTNLQAQESQLQAKQDFLSALISTKKTELADFDQQLARAREEAARRAAEKARREAEARARANAEAVTRQRQLEEQRRREEEQRRQQEAQQQQATARNDEVDEEDEIDYDADNADYVEEEEEVQEETKEETKEESSNPAPSTSVSGSSVAGYAAQFVGNPYKWGGNSLTSGCDCSGFVVQVYSHFGVNLSGSRSSGALTGVGKSVSYENIQPGDIVCYSGHVAIYAGGGRIVEAQSTKAGITSNRSVTCKPIVAIRRVV